MSCFGRLVMVDGWMDGGREGGREGYVDDTPPTNNKIANEHRAGHREEAMSFLREGE